MKNPTKALKGFQKTKQEFVKAILQDGNATKAYLVTHPEREDMDNVAMNAQRYTRDVEVRQTIGVQLDRHGLSVPYLNSRLRQLTASEKQIILKDELVAVPDNPTSLEALKVAYKLHRLIDSPVVNIDARQQTIDLSSENVNKIDITIQALDKLTQAMRSMEITGEVLR